MTVLCQSSSLELYTIDFPSPNDNWNVPESVKSCSWTFFQRQIQNVSIDKPSRIQLSTHLHISHPLPQVSGFSPLLVPLLDSQSDIQTNHHQSISRLTARPGATRHGATHLKRLGKLDKSTNRIAEWSPEPPTSAPRSRMRPR